MAQEIWEKPEIIIWSQILLDSYEKLLGKELIKRNGSPLHQSKALFLAPLVVVSHGTQSDPILNYGNQLALDLWELTWDSFISTPSSLTAEPVKRETRQQMLSRVKMLGFVENYQDVRISSTGKRFLASFVTVWNLADAQNHFCGQAATFPPPNKFLSSTLKV